MSQKERQGPERRGRPGLLIAGVYSSREQNFQDMAYAGKEPTAGKEPKQDSHSLEMNDSRPQVFTGQSSEAASSTSLLWDAKNIIFKLDKRQ